MGATIEAKLVVLGSQNVGKTSLVHRLVKGTFLPPSTPTTVGASFTTALAHDAESDTTIRLQVWDTAGQERFRSISKLYYRGANAAVLCYDVTSRRSFEEMGVWLQELKEKATIEGSCGDGEDTIIHIVGTKSDIVAEDPSRREVPFERCIDYVASKLYPDQNPVSAHPSYPVTQNSTRPPSALMSTPPGSNGLHVAWNGNLQPGKDAAMMSPTSNRSSGFWGQEHVWDCCHEISAKDGEGIEEVFRVITRKLVDQHHQRQERLRAIEASQGRTPGFDGAFNGNGGAGGQAGYFDLPGAGNGSFRLGHGDKRRSWLGFPTTPGALSSVAGGSEDAAALNVRRGGRCC